MTKDDMIKDMQKESEYYAESGNRLKNGALDDHYIAAYEEYPTAKKIDLLRMAIQAAGLDMKATRQRAYEIHTRLADTLETRLLSRVKDARHLGLSVVIDLAKNAKSEQVKCTAGLALTKDLMPDVQINKTDTITDIDERLEKGQKEIEQLTGFKH